MFSCAETLGNEGPLARAVPGFTARPGQQAMAEQVWKAVHARTTLVCEAGTGIGKTFAYLVAALLCGRRVIISTGTKTLQDQLFHRDLPVVQQALAVSVSTALLKGRANYLCLHRLHQQVASGTLPTAGQAQLLRLQSWAQITDRGDIAEVTGVPEDAAIWPLVTSTPENCLGQECKYFSDCWVVKARREAQAAEVVVVNHHLFLADLALKEQGFGEVLPGADAVIFDEAHQLPQTAAQFFGSTLSSRQFVELTRDAVQAQVSEAGDSPSIREAASRLEKAVRDMRLALGGSEQRAVWAVDEDGPGMSALRQVEGRLQSLQALLDAAAERGPALANCLRRCEALSAQLRAFAAPENAGSVRWFETHARGFSLYQTPLEIAGKFQEYMNSRSCAWVFTSATLAVGEDFSYFTHQLGLDAAATQRLDSPFDYARQALLYLPRVEVDPRHADYTRAVVEVTVPVLEASCGRAFLLFTSHRSLQEAHALLRGRVGYPLFTQGEALRGELLERFRRTPNAVLLGTASFWEGVDVRGEALSCVIIDKLPFAAPDDPVTQARIRALRGQGRNPFTEYQLPEAVIALKQGAGRLIRDVGDRGVLVLCDPRLRSMSYGRIFLRALPPLRKTERLADVRAFFADTAWHPGQNPSP
ncbi:MAG: ATP-dependent DNA helicase [Chromatiales bacterium]